MRKGIQRGNNDMGTNEGKEQISCPSKGSFARQEKKSS